MKALRKHSYPFTIHRPDILLTTQLYTTPSFAYPQYTYVQTSFPQCVASPYFAYTFMQTLLILSVLGGQLHNHIILCFKYIFGGVRCNTTYKQV